MGKILLSALFALLAINFLFASCPKASRSINLAAVTGENSGGVFLLEVETRPGNGTIYTSILPRVGFLTQESQEAAVNYAFSSSGFSRHECDVLFKIKGNFGENSVDGPSAGGAMAVALRAALLNKTVRQDVVMTGSLLPDGKIGEVGGVIEKGIGVAEAGARYFLVPKLKIYEAILFSTLSSSKDFHAIEISSVADAERVLFSNYSEKFSHAFKPESMKLPQLKPIAMDADLARFSLVAKMVVDGLERKVKAAFRQERVGEEEKVMRDYFASEISKYRSLLSLGYPFSAANSAFLLSIDAEYARLGEASMDLDATIENAKRCADSLQAARKTKENIHWAIGSDLRRIWSQSKLNETVEGRPEQSGYTTLRDVLYSYSWCEISQMLGMQAEEIGGEGIDEKELAELASQKLARAKEVLEEARRPDYDALWHYKNGLKANESGYYGAAIYEAVYAISMQEAAFGLQGNLTAICEKLSTSERKTLWGKIYQGQGAYLYQEAVQSSAPLGDAYRILKYSQAIDDAAVEIEERLATNEAAIVEEATSEKTPQLTYENFAIWAVLAGAVFALGGLAAFRLARKR